MKNFKGRKEDFKSNKEEEEEEIQQEKDPHHNIEPQMHFLLKIQVMQIID